MKHKILRTIFILVACFLVFWIGSVLRCEILTMRYGKLFEEIYRENTMMGEIDYLKVLDCRETSARVYYVSEHRSGGDILTFELQDGQWVYAGWERTVWSRTGSADGFLWPYIR